MLFLKYLFYILTKYTFKVPLKTLKLSVKTIWSCVLTLCIAHLEARKSLLNAGFRRDLSVSIILKQILHLIAGLLQNMY